MPVICNKQYGRIACIKQKYMTFFLFMCSSNKLQIQYMPEKYCYNNKLQLINSRSSSKEKNPLDYTSYRSSNV